MSSAFSRLLCLSVCGLAVASAAVTPEQPVSLRVCADPNNLPFSDQQQQGFQNQIATLLSHSLRMKLSYTWWVERDNLIRNTLDAHRCDLLLGLPEGVDEALLTKPYYRSSYVFVYRKDSPFQLSTLDDSILEKLRIGVHILGDGFAPPATVLAHRGIRANVEGFSMLGAYGDKNPPARLIDAVENKTVDVAIVWGPLGGYFAQRESIPLKVVPVSPDHYGPVPFTYSIAMAVRKNDVALCDRVNAALASNARQIEAILNNYGVPQRKAQ